MAKKLSPMEQKSSKKVLDALRSETQGMMKGKMDGLKKVTVASDSPQGLEKGLELAKKIAGKLPEDEAAESVEDEALESDEEEAQEESDGSEILPEEEAMTAEQLDAHIKALQALRLKK